MRRRKWARPRAMATSARRSQPGLKRRTRRLTLPSLFTMPGRARVLTESLGPLPPPLRQQERLSRPRSAFHRHVRRPHSQATPATDPAALPPRSGFRRSFAPPMLSHERARSSSITRAIDPGSRGPRAACRLLQSKRSLSTAARSIEPRSPRSRSPRSTASSAPLNRLSPPQQPAGRVARLPSLLSKRVKLSQPRGHGPGPGFGFQSKPRLFQHQPRPPERS